MTAVLPSLPETTFAEYEELKAVLDAASRRMAIRVACEVSTHGREFPIYVATVGSLDPQAPAIGFFGGIHGLERIGTRLLLDYMRTLVARLEWDELLQNELQSVRLVFMPIVNPGGMWDCTASSPTCRRD